MSETKKTKVYTPDKLIKTMRKLMDKPRYIHTLGVAYTAASLAMAHDESMEKARLAGLLHDCGKPMSNEDKIKLCEENKIFITDHEYGLPHLLHAKVGAYLAKKVYGVKDDDVLNAIRFHTTGRPGMSKLEKIIYVADYIEPQRSEAPNLKRVRKLAFEDLDYCLFVILEDTLGYLESKKDTIDPATRDTFLYYRRIISDKGMI